MTDDDEPLHKHVRLAVAQRPGPDGSRVQPNLYRKNSIPRLGDLTKITLQLRSRPDPSPSKDTLNQSVQGTEKPVSYEASAPLPVPPISYPSELPYDPKRYVTPVDFNAHNDYVDHSDDSRITVATHESGHRPPYLTPNSSPPTPTKAPVTKLAANISSRAAEALLRSQGQLTGIPPQISTQSINGPTSSSSKVGIHGGQENHDALRALLIQSGQSSGVRPSTTSQSSNVAKSQAEIDKAALSLCLQAAESKPTAAFLPRVHKPNAAYSPQAPVTPVRPVIGQSTISQANSQPVPKQLPTHHPVIAKTEKFTRITSFTQAPVYLVTKGASLSSSTQVRQNITAAAVSSDLADSSPCPRSNLFEAVYGIPEKTPAVDYKLEKLNRKLSKLKLLQDFSDRAVHIFVDMSNIFIGFEEKCREKRGIPKNQYFHIDPKDFLFRQLHHILARNRSVDKKSLAGSVAHAAEQIDPPAHFLEAQKLDYKVSMMLRVMKIDKNDKAGFRPNNMIRRTTSGFTSSPYVDWTTSSGDESSDGSPSALPRTKLGEQGVDENLHLAMQSSILDAAVPGNGTGPGVMVLATGDAKEAEFSEGFAHYAQKAMSMGWHVEVVSWKRCLSSIWRRAPFTDRFASQFRIIELDTFYEDMLAGKL